MNNVDSPSVTTSGSASTALVSVCRHGKVDNPHDVLYARLPEFHLSTLGVAMAECLGEFFAGMPIHVLSSSPLERAQETMAPIAALHPGGEVCLDWRLIEADSAMQGQVKGLFSLGLAKPSNWKYFVHPSQGSFGEGYAPMAARMVAAVADAGVTAGPGGRAVLVSHQAPIWVARRLVEGKFLFNIPAMRQCALASVTTFSVDADGNVSFVGYEEPAHDVRA